ncbi:MAG: hypothetical protein COV44_10145 [Deltaproteobacteria bacterium CG11_big_fil_rev_8_21_14_0_20_45_16]|nr:MAG: hypothetical protein COV44_10145 [Deltaproteobacteria bacterium CG11_big_fil_rev_8_21_14_0_20_45_16]
MPKLPRVAVIIPAYNEENVIGNCIESLLRQTYENFCAHIIDDQSTDTTQQIIRRYAEAYPNKIKLQFFGKLGPGKARNRVATEVAADIYAFTDADCEVTPRWLEELIRGIDFEGVVSCGGPQLAHPTSTDFQQKLERFFSLTSPLIDFYQNKTDISETRHNPLCNVAYRSEVFRSLKGFREDLFPGEDVEIDLRIKQRGHRIHYNPRAIVFHHRPESIAQFKKVMRAYGRAQGKLFRESGPRRTIQYIGIIASLFTFGIIIASLLLQNLGLLVAALLIVAGFYFIRPNSESLLSILLNSLEWFNGFLIGLFTNKSPPPGMNIGTKHDVKT